MRSRIFRIFVLIVVSIVFGFAFANAETNVNTGTEQGQQQAQEFIYNPVVSDSNNNNTSLGSLLSPGNHIRTGMLYIPTDQPMGVQINNVRSNQIAGIFRVYDEEGFKVFRETGDMINGKGYFERISKGIRRMPAITRVGTHEVKEVLFLKDSEAAKIQMRPEIEVYGTIGYDTDLDKKYPIGREQVYVFAGKDARDIAKANVMIPLLDAFRNQFRAGSFGADLLGVISKLVAVNNTYGFGFGSGIDFVAGKNATYGEAGTLVAFVYIPPELLVRMLNDPAEEITQRMTKREKDLAECTKTHPNARLHTEQGDDNIVLYGMAKEGDPWRLAYLNNARFHYERALKNGVRDSDEENRIWIQLSKIYVELALVAETTVSRNDHAKKAETYARKAGLTELHRF